MRIVIYSTFYPFRGGIAQFNAIMYRCFEKNHEVKAYTFKQQYPSLLFPGKSQMVQPGDVVDQTPAERAGSPFNPLSYFGAARKIRKSNPDLFITIFWIPLFGWLLGYIGKKLKGQSKRLLLLHNVIPHEKRFFDRWLTTYMLKHYDGFIVMSEKVENDLLSLKPDAKFVRLQHPWYDHFGDPIPKEHACQKLGVDDSKRVLLFFGLIRDYKGLDILLDAFELLDDRYALVIAGEVYGNVKKYEDQIARSRGKDRILFNSSYVSDMDVPTYFSAADVTILPYRTATQSGITATSFHFETPIIATNVGSFEKLVGRDYMGCIVDESSPEAIAKEIDRYFDQNLKEQFIANIKAEKKNNSWELFADKWIEFAATL